VVPRGGVESWTQFFLPVSAGFRHECPTKNLRCQQPKGNFGTYIIANYSMRRERARPRAADDFRMIRARMEELSPRTRSGIGRKNEPFGEPPEALPSCREKRIGPEAEPAGPPLMHRRPQGGRQRSARRADRPHCGQRASRLARPRRGAPARWRKEASGGEDYEGASDRRVRRSRTDSRPQVARQG
jgi:hypothetical protein